MIVFVIVTCWIGKSCADLTHFIPGAAVYYLR